VRRALDEDSFTVRFTPRRPGSVWSSVNIARARKLEAEGRLRPPGVAAFEARTARSAERYSYESPIHVLGAAYEKKFRASPKAWAFYRARPPGYRRISAFWVMSAKQEPTRWKRLEVLIAHSHRGEPIPLLDRRPKKSAKQPPARPSSRGGIRPRAQ
jgi:uncharacterized protein YdeI (YjbR/CyaY-like superfamily)